MAATFKGQVSGNETIVPLSFDASAKHLERRLRSFRSNTAYATADDINLGERRDLQSILDSVIFSHRHL